MLSRYASDGMFDNQPNPLKETISLRLFLQDICFMGIIVRISLDGIISSGFSVCNRH